MNTIVELGVIYCLITMGAAGTLFFSFKGKMDLSARLFLLAELLMVLMCLAVSVTNIFPELAIPPIFYITNVAIMSSEITILFSIYALDKKVIIRQYLLSILLALIYCGLIEFARFDINARMPVAMQGIQNLILATLVFRACNSCVDLNLKQNQFLKWIAYLELGLGVLALIRILSYFSQEPILPRNPTTLASIFFAFYLTFSVFRYISYQSLRITWIDNMKLGANTLNKKIVELMDEKDKLLQNLIASNRSIGVGALAASLSHELSQPLTGIALETESVKRNLTQSGNNGESIDSLEKIGAQISKLGSLVRNLRQLFSSQSSSFNTTDLHKIIEDILEILNPTLQSKSINLNKVFYSKPLIFADAIQIQQILINILNNAIESICESNPQEKKIDLLVSNDDKNATIIIKDNGHGIQDTLLPTIFDLYKTSKKDGLGIGLWLSKMIIDKHHGSISASNSSYGGAIFEIKLPLFDGR